jgi:ssDNA-binding Zn-finger/Zn-ribbon topoisomerase 1
MALIQCPECQSEVSERALECPKCGVQLRRLKRGVFGKICKWAFIGFNLLMALWLFSYWGSVGELTDSATSDAEMAGAAVGATLGTGLLFGFWVMGDIILGLFVLFTRPKA